MLTFYYWGCPPQKSPFVNITLKIVHLYTSQYLCIFILFNVIIKIIFSYRELLLINMVVGRIEILIHSGFHHLELIFHNLPSNNMC